MHCTLNLPFPPSLNNLFRNVRGKGRVPTARYEDWRKRATHAMWGQPMVAITEIGRAHV